MIRDWLQCLVREKAICANRAARSFVGAMAVGDGETAPTVACKMTTEDVEEAIAMKATESRRRAGLHEDHHEAHPTTAAPPESATPSKTRPLKDAPRSRGLPLHHKAHEQPEIRLIHP